MKEKESEKVFENALNLASFIGTHLAENKIGKKESCIGMAILTAFIMKKMDFSLRSYIDFQCHYFEVCEEYFDFEDEEEEDEKVDKNQENIIKKLYDGTDKKEAVQIMLKDICKTMGISLEDIMKKSEGN